VSDNDDKAKIAALEKRIAELERKTQPPPKIPVAPPLQGISATERLAIDPNTFLMRWRLLLATTLFARSQGRTGANERDGKRKWAASGHTLGRCYR
jgi:hypothetical protein